MTSPEPPPQRALSAELLHDLRTHLNHIIGFSEFLTEQAVEEGLTTFASDLLKIQGAGRKLLDLVNNGLTPCASASTTTVLDAVPAEPQTSGAERSPAEESQGQILVVDDNGSNREVLCRRLQQMGYGVASAESGRDAMAAVRTRSFDLVLLDIMMPEMDGYEVLDLLKADPALRHIPVVMISGLDELESVAKCIQMGAEDYLPKPFNPTLLKARVGACLEQKRAHDREVDLFDQVQDSYKRLQDLEQQRDDLTHMIIHDLRTPLTSLITGIQTLDVVGDLNYAQREMMGIAVLGGESLLGMINDLLDVEKMESGAMQLDYGVLSAAELVASAVGQVASLAEGRQLALVQKIADGLPPLLGDESKLRRTLVNLLGNSIKFTPSGGTVTVGARLSDGERSVEFSVSDTGEGIPPDSFGRIFEKFGQVESRKSGRMVSTGLGLTFCKLAVESHGGQISVSSAPDQGSTFCFTVPLPQ
ncbi:MAG: hybrid sensor histidine kinase/response regulator [Fimbriimonadaceae bacterium]